MMRRDMTIEHEIKNLFKIKSLVTKDIVSKPITLKIIK